MKVSIRDRLEAVGASAWDGLVAASRLRSPFLSWAWQSEWARTFAAVLEAHNLSWLDPGIAAAVALDLGFGEYAAMGLFQLSHAPGVLAHGVEMIGLPLTAMPFLGDESYIHE